MTQLTARRATLADAARITEIYNQGIIDRVATFETEPRTVETIRGWFDQPYPIVVVENGAEVIAWANASPYRPRLCYAKNVEFSVYVDRDWRGRGAGTIAMQLLIDESRTAGLEKLISRVFIENTASLHMLGGLGFRAVGIYERHAQLDGVWRDVVIVERLLQDRADEPRGALWQPDSATLDLWNAFLPGVEIIVEKRPWESDRRPIRYGATVLSSSVDTPWIETRAEWTLDTTNVFGIVFEKGGELREFFSPRHPFNAFGVYGLDGTFRGWYGNVTRPALAGREDDTLLLTWADLVLDLVILPDGSTVMLDDDEIDASGLRDSSPWIIDQMFAAREELKRLLKTGFFPRL